MPRAAIKERCDSGLIRALARIAQGRCALRWEGTDDDRRPPIEFRPLRAQNEVIEFVLAANQLEIELPKIVTTPMSSTATSAIKRPYSVTAMPESSRTNLRMVADIGITVFGVKY